MNLLSSLRFATLLTLGSFAAASSASALSYAYVGNWTLGDGPVWNTNPTVLSGQETAALLFGGSASDYAISTISDLVADINFKTWLDGWADGFTYANSGNAAAQDFKLDLGGAGYDSQPGYGSAYSAYVADHFNPAWGYQNPNLKNYAFRIIGDPDRVPDGGATALMLLISMVPFWAIRRARKAN